MLFFGRKIGILGFVAQTNGDLQQTSGGAVGFGGCDDGKIHQLVLFTRYHDVVTKLNKRRTYALLGPKGLTGRGGYGLKVPCE